ncbi:MAG: IS21 family transposase, partial [Clostridiaceae bacterium]|nr:IS21 family transposase [Clostridiaceae bacterium]
MDDLIAIVKEFNKDINNEICQTTGQTPYERHQYEKEYLLPIPSKDLIASYINSTLKRKVS